MMAASGSSQSSQPIPTQPNSEQAMNVDESHPQKRKAGIPVPSDSEEDGPVGTPVNNPNPTAAMSVEDLVRFSIAQNEKHFNKLDQDISKLQREGSETRRMAARAVTSAEKTKGRVDKIEKRLAQLETQQLKTPPSHAPAPSPAQNRTDWNELGGKMVTPSF